ncbi:MAG: hypothetical protein D6781_10090 [Verrucomicrobia bacterium]|nr:MAG: hypothetical protein D6781_10090 [Verrucomicrobiota bacterium]
MARVTSKQVPLFARDIAVLCEEIELPRREITRLFRDGFLSFDPAGVGELDESAEAEVRFLGGLVAAGCPRAMLRVLLRDLRKPYSYDLDRLYYDWKGGRWRLLPGEDDAQGSFFALLDRLEERGARHSLERIREWLNEALDMEETGRLLFAHEQDREREPEPEDDCGDAV